MKRKQLKVANKKAEEFNISKIMTIRRSSLKAQRVAFQTLSALNRGTDSPFVLPHRSKQTQDVTYTISCEAKVSCHTRINELIKSAAENYKRPQ